jgi:hydroxyethylthiazole kinase
MGLCGERAFLSMTGREGNASFRNHLIDEVFRLTGEVLESGAQSEIR